MVRLFFDVHEAVARDTLESLVDISHKDPEGAPLVVGGMALQLYAATHRDLLRPTSDIDLYDPKNRDYEAFVASTGSNVQGFLRERGYQVQLKRGKAKNEVKIMKGQGQKAEELFFAHLGRYNPDTWRKVNQVFARQVANAKSISLPYEGSEQIRVIRIEDMLPYKIRRMKHALEQYVGESGIQSQPLYGAMLQMIEDSNWGSLASMDLNKWCEIITTMQNQLIVPNMQTTNERAKYVVNKDLYDICLLARLIESKPELFNRAYYSNSKQEVDEAFRR